MYVVTIEQDSINNIIVWFSFYTKSSWSRIFGSARTKTILFCFDVHIPTHKQIPGFGRLQ